MKTHSRSSTIFVGGGITIDTLTRYMDLGPDVAIFGSGVQLAPDPVKEAKGFRELIRRASTCLLRSKASRAPLTMG
ncbi:hypothetical protein [Rhodoblastus sp.]|uniref:hypothetical protein n=1 Tax=Rhodoblastus sp. TaxID=1962975 RepID=UPI003F9A1306